MTPQPQKRVIYNPSASADITFSYADLEPSQASLAPLKRRLKVCGRLFRILAGMGYAGLCFGLMEVLLYQSFEVLGFSILVLLVAVFGDWRAS